MIYTFFILTDQKFNFTYIKRRKRGQVCRVAFVYEVKFEFVSDYRIIARNA
jgi:hypothetical protein